MSPVSSPGVGGVPSFVQFRGLVGSFGEVDSASSDLCDQPLCGAVLMHPDGDPCLEEVGVIRWLSGACPHAEDRWRWETKVCLPVSTVWFGGL